MAATAPGHSESLPDCAESSAAWEVGSAAHKISGDYCITSIVEEMPLINARRSSHGRIRTSGRLL
jgi:hypothetical protein